jgi:hypothetical protein
LVPWRFVPVPPPLALLQPSPGATALDLLNGLPGMGRSIQRATHRSL